MTWPCHFAYAIMGLMARHSSFTKNLRKAGNTKLLAFSSVYLFGAIAIVLIVLWIVFWNSQR
jgi:hypothetical protein